MYGGFHLQRVKRCKNTFLLQTDVCYNRTFYRPQTKFAMVMFSQMSVCPEGGVCHFLGRHPPGRHTPWADTPLVRHSPLVRHPPGRHPPAQCMLAYTPCPAHAGIHPLPSACWDTVNKRAVRIPLECIPVTIAVNDVGTKKSLVLSRTLRMYAYAKH